MGWKRLSILLQLALVVGLWSAQARASSSCLPDFNSLQIMETFDSQQTHDFVHPLKSMNANGMFVTRAQLKGTYESQNHSLTIKLQFDPDFAGVSLAYNLYALMVVENGAVIRWMDLTRECRGPGAGFFPGQVIELPKVKLSGGGRSTVRIIVWGRL